MTTNEEQERTVILETLKDQMQALAGKTVTLGFDGFIDSVVRVIQHKDHQQPTSYFESTESFGKYIVDKGGKNFSIELEEVTTKLGGNMPIMSNALSQFGLSVSCIGSLGYPHIHPVFQLMPPNCQLHSFANPGTSNVLEFTKGKIMLCEMEALNHLSWEFIRDRIGVNIFHDLFSKSELVSLLNWSEMDNSTEIWKGLLRDVLPHITPKKRPMGFFDLSDCSKRTDENISEAMDLIRSFAGYWDVVLSLNMNEASIIYSVLTKKKPPENQVEEMCKELFDVMKIEAVIIHYAGQAVACIRDGMHRRNSFFLKTPAISTGSGDNFNAGVCLGRLVGLDIGASLVLGHATSNLYMQSGQSPNVKQLVDFLS